MALKKVPVGDWVDYEPVVNDWRMHNVADYLRRDFPALPDDTDFVTFRQPSKMVAREDGLEVPAPEMAIFAVISDNPRYKTFRVMTNGATHLSSWNEAVAEFQHYAGRPDPLIQIFRALVQTHLRTLTNLQEMD